MGESPSIEAAVAFAATKGEAPQPAETVAQTDTPAGEPEAGPAATDEGQQA